MLLRYFSSFLICAAALGATVPTIDQSLGMQSVGGAEISPDGKYVAFTVTQANWDENDFVSQIWIAMTDSGKRYRLTSGKKEEADLPDFSDGRRSGRADGGGERHRRDAMVARRCMDRVHIDGAGCEGQERTQRQVR
jgi:dipeptidyl aminopeptidase/acylaminoacyl peptidase